MKTKIIAVSGRGGSGKSSLGKWLVGYSMACLGIIKGPPHFDLRYDNLYIYDLFGDKNFEGIFDHRIGTDDMNNFLKENLNDYLMCFAFADELKKICVNQFGIEPRLIYGTQADKNELTHLMWENMPSVCTDKKIYRAAIEAVPELKKFLVYHAPGPMTSREFQQFLGTNIFRRADLDCHARSVLQKIVDNEPIIAFIDDQRFLNEVDMVKQYNGISIRLTRKSNDDNHQSESELDNYDGFDYVIDNQDYTTDQLCQEFYEILKKEGLVV